MILGKEFGGANHFVDRTRDYTSEIDMSQQTKWGKCEKRSQDCKDIQERSQSGLPFLANPSLCLLGSMIFRTSQLLHLEMTAGTLVATAATQ